MTKNNGSNVTVRELYTLVDQKMAQTHSAIERLENKFDTLEAGRLSATEKAVSEVTAQVAGLKGQAMMIPLIITIAANAFFFILNLMLNR